MSKSLFEINAEYLNAIIELENYCEENQTDEVPEGIHDRLSINKDELNDKLEAYFHVVVELEGKLETMSNYIKSMNKKKKSIENNIERLKNYVGIAVESFGETSKSGSKFYTHDLFKVTASRSNRLKVVNEDLLPSEYKEEETIVKVTVKTNDLKKALNKGEEIEGAFIDDTIINVSFR